MRRLHSDEKPKLNELVLGRDIKPEVTEEEVREAVLAQIKDENPGLSTSEYSVLLEDRLTTVPISTTLSDNDDGPF